MADDANLPPEGTEHQSRPPASAGAARPETGKSEDSAFEEALAEVNFFIQQGLLVESIHMLRELRRTHGDHPRIIGRENAVRALLRQKLSQPGSEEPATPQKTPTAPGAAGPTKKAPPAAAARPKPPESKPTTAPGPVAPRPPVQAAATRSARPLPKLPVASEARHGATTLDRLRKLKQDAATGDSAPPAEAGVASPAPAGPVEEELPPPLPPVPEVEEPTGSSAPLFPARTMTLPLGTPSPALTTKTPAAAEQADPLAADPVRPRPSRPKRSKVERQVPKQAETTKPEPIRSTPGSDSAVRVYPAPADAAVSPLVPFHEGDDDFETGVFKSRDGPVPETGPKPQPAEATSNRAATTPPKLEPVATLPASSEPLAAEGPPEAPVEPLALAEAPAEAATAERGGISPKKLLLFAGVPLAVAVVVLLVLILRSGPEQRARSPKAPKEEIAATAAVKPSAPVAVDAGSAAADASVESRRTRTLQDADAGASAASDPKDANAPAAPDQTDAGSTIAAAQNDSGTERTKNPAAGSQPSEPRADKTPRRTAASNRVRLTLTILPRQAVVVVIFRGKKYWGNKFRSPPVAPTSKAETVRIRAKSYKDFDLPVTLSEDTSRVVKLQRKKRRMKLFDLKLREGK